MASTSQPIIPIKSFQFHYLHSGNGSLPAFSGSAWRGALGHALKKTVCVVRNIACNQCLLKNACAYSYVFETPPPTNTEKMRKYTSVPHPFVLQLPASVDAEDYTVKLNLFGHGERYLPYLIHALQKAGEEGIGGQRKVFHLQSVEDVMPSGKTETIYQQGLLQTPRTAVLLKTVCCFLVALICFCGDKERQNVIRLRVCDIHHMAKMWVVMTTAEAVAMEASFGSM